MYYKVLRTISRTQDAFLEKGILIELALRGVIISLYIWKLAPDMIFLCLNNIFSLG